MTSVIWKSDEGQRRLESWYSVFLTKIGSEVESLSAKTRYGDSHVLVAGNPNGPPLVCLHAMRTGASYLLSELGPIMHRYRVIAPDLPGQSVRGLDVRLPLNDGSQADWLFDVLDHMDLDTVAVFGVSWGGFVARLAASHAPERVSRLGMLVPAGIANGSHITGLIKMLGPMLRYRMRRSKKNLRRLLAPILTTWDEDWASAIECTLNDMKVDYRIPPLAKDQELESLRMPTLVLAADQDISFPGNKVVDRVNRLIPKVDAEIIPNCRHCPPTHSEFQNWLAQRLIDFFETP